MHAGSFPLDCKRAPSFSICSTFHTPARFQENYVSYTWLRKKLVNARIQNTYSQLQKTKCLALGTVRKVCGLNIVCKHLYADDIPLHVPVLFA